MSVSYPPHVSHRNLLPPSLWQPVAGFTPPTPPSDAEKQQQQQLAGAVRVLWDRASSPAQLQAAIDVANASGTYADYLANLVAATEARLEMGLVGQQVPRSTLSRKLQHGAWLGVWGMAHAESAWWTARSTRLSMVLLCMVLLSMARHATRLCMALHGARAQHMQRHQHGLSTGHAQHMAQHAPPRCEARSAHHCSPWPHHGPISERSPQGEAHAPLRCEALP